MGRVPNHETAPDFSNEEHTMPESLAYLNPEVESKQTPLMISSLIVDWTTKFSDEAGKLVNPDNYPGLVIDWQKEYEGDDVYWVPENRWTHEVVRKPVQIEEDTFAVYLDADAYMQKFEKEYHVKEYNERFADAYIHFITRTLYKYIDEDNDSEIQVDYGLIPQNYFFIHRWLPSFPAKIHYWIDQDIEDKLHISMKPGIIDCTDLSQQTINIPFRVKQSMLTAMPYIKHDSLVYYIRVEKV